MLGKVKGNKDLAVSNLRNEKETRSEISRRRFFSHHGSISYKYWIQKVGQVFCVLKVIQELPGGH